MSNPRDDLAALITQALAAVKRPGTASIILDVADAILAAGYVKPKPPKVYPDHDIETYRVPICGICGKDVEWDDNTKSWKH